MNVMRWLVFLIKQIISAVFFMRIIPGLIVRMMQKNTRLNYLNIIEHRRFPVKLTKYLRTFLFTEDLCWLVLLLIRSSGYFKFILTESS